MEMEPTDKAEGSTNVSQDGHTINILSENGSTANHSQTTSLHHIAKAKAEAKDALIDHLQHQLEVKEELVVHLQGRLEELDKTQDSLQKALHQACTNAEALRKKYQGLATTVENLTSECEHLRSENARLVSSDKSPKQAKAEAPSTVIDTLHRFGLLMTMQQLGSSVSTEAIQQSVGALSAALGPVLADMSVVPQPTCQQLQQQQHIHLSYLQRQLQILLQQQRCQLQQLQQSKAHCSQPMERSADPLPTPLADAQPKAPQGAGQQMDAEQANPFDIFDPELLLKRLSSLPSMPLITSAMNILPLPLMSLDICSAMPFTVPMHANVGHQTAPMPPGKGSTKGSAEGMNSSTPLGHPLSTSLTPPSPISGSQRSITGAPCDTSPTASPSKESMMGWDEASDVVSGGFDKDATGSPLHLSRGSSNGVKGICSATPSNYDAADLTLGEGPMGFPHPVALDSEGEPVPTSPRSIDCSASPAAARDRSPSYYAYDDEDDAPSEEGDIGASETSHSESIPSRRSSTPTGGRRGLEDRKNKTQNETHLIEIVVGLLEDNAMNPYKGSVPVERIQNVVRSQHNQLYNLIVGSRHNSWKRFLEFHPKVFHLFCVDDGKWRMRLVKHGAWREADLQEQEERQLKEYHLISCLTTFLRSQPALSCRVDDFRLAYPTLSQNQPREGVAEPLYPLPARGDLTRFVRRHPNDFLYDKDNFSIILKEKDTFNFLLKPGPDEGPV